jgi:tRNA pseudouridine32 synthase/23S rRNA pseudouridine746 synthase
MIVHHDNRIVVADKPAGLPTVPGRPIELHDCLWQRVRTQFGDALVVHRLDMATSGLVVFARGIEMQRDLGAAFAARRVHKRYVAVVHGRVASDVGQIDLPLAADWPNRPRQRVDHERGKASTTRFAVVERGATSTRLALEPLTGRSHQLRVHLAAIGHPILGDALYGDAAVRAAASRLLLHASGLGFTDPDGRARHFESPTPF